MELKEAIYKRRSVRKYEDTPVPQKVLQELLEGACMAPSGINQQPWYFLAITNEADRQRYLSFMEEGFSRFRPTLEKRFSRNPEVVEETGTFMTTLGGAPVVILTVLLKDDYLKTNGGRPAIQGVAAAIENLLLLAHDRGLAGCWMTSPVDFGLGDALRQAFAPEKGELLAVISLGYPKESPTAPPRREGRFDII